MFWFGTDNAHNTLSTNDRAFITNLFLLKDVLS